MHIGTVIYIQSGIHTRRLTNTYTHTGRHTYMHTHTYIHPNMPTHIHIQLDGVNIYTHADRQAESARHQGYKHILIVIHNISLDMIPVGETHTQTSMITHVWILPRTGIHPHTHAYIHTMPYIHTGHGQHTLHTYNYT